ncbi:Cyclic nucleotide-binding domain-containing protein [Cohaesibacter marisflavi]|uniref:Cyclic nucleotide-binding domain-containing protein n=1 Tax=Cohaesibacter marisflavi TaxID=655353 RepID=A0A1I5GLA0_9HYPH|nr:cyclic nucleotide-binding domain-containing protein [Cohaesibacter marisflavi]SFO36755.1 Cyclic nucleotide-binding domain-containing protein [Cohaesibacter marisflavi]
MSLTSDIDLLKQVPFFDNFDNDQLRLLAFGAEMRAYRAKQVIFRQGDLADSGFVITEGQIRMTISENGFDLQSQVLGPGSLIGEMALMAETRRSAMATAIEDVKVIQIRRVTFRRVMDEYPELAAIIHDRVAGRLAGLVDDLEKVRSKLGHEAEEEMSLEEAEAFVKRG